MTRFLKRFLPEWYQFSMLKNESSRQMIVKQKAANRKAQSVEKVSTTAAAKSGFVEEKEESSSDSSDSSSDDEHFEHELGPTMDFVNPDTILHIDRPVDFGGVMETYTHLLRELLMEPAALTFRTR